MYRLLLSVFIQFLAIVFVAAADDCPISKCRHGGPVIMFPFRLKGDPPHCGHPEFEVSCFKNVTMIQLSSSSGLFPIRNIDYRTRTFEVYNDDADGCLPRRLVNFNASDSSLFQPYPSQPPLFLGYIPQGSSRFYNCADYRSRSEMMRPDPYNFEFNPKLKEFTLLNCSTLQNFSTESFMRSVSVEFIPIKCLSVPGNQVLAVPPSTSPTDLPVPTCSTWRPLYLPLRARGEDYCEPDNALLLKWIPWHYFPQCQNCTERKPWCEYNSTSNQMECTIAPAIDPPQRPKGHHASTRYIIAGVAIASFVLVSAMAVAIFFHVQRSNSIEEKENQMRVEKFLNDHRSHVPARYSYADIKKMTNGFKNKLGKGGFGCVYSGKLPNGVPVAVKVLIDSNGNGDDFVNEVGTIGRIHHVNVVRLLGFSAEGGKRAVIYELMPNRSLEKFISSKEKSRNASFDWEKLNSIVTGIAKGIEYLHQGCEQRILHLDIKPHNILLDHEFNPKISDFGLAKLCSKEDSFISMISARGTVGYIAPEVFNGNFGSVSHKSDVYSFGMLVLEIAGAMQESALTSSHNEDYFPELIYNRLIQGEALGLKLETGGDVAHQIAKKLLIVALWCIQWYPVNRPSMKAVVRMLEGATENLIMPPNPFASTTSTQA